LNILFIFIILCSVSPESWTCCLHVCTDSSRTSFEYGNMIFLGPRTNAEFVPKCHVALLACRESLPVFATEFFPYRFLPFSKNPPFAPLPIQIKNSAHRLQRKNFFPPLHTENTCYYCVAFFTSHVFRYQKDPSEPCLGKFIAVEFLIPGNKGVHYHTPHFFVFFLTLYISLVPVAEKIKYRSPFRAPVLWSPCTSPPGVPRSNNQELPASVVTSFRPHILRCLVWVWGSLSLWGIVSIEQLLD